MFVLRLVGLLLLIGIGMALAVYVFTKDRRYLTFAWQLLKYGVVMAAVVLIFILVERIATIV